MGSVLHKSSKSELDTMVQAVFIRESYNENQSVANSLVQHTYFITSGDELLQERLDFATSPYRGPTRWSSILSDTFPEWTSFSEPLVTKAFGRLLEQVALHAQLKYSAISSGTPEAGVMSLLHWKGYGSLYHPRHTGLDFLHFARKILPELSRCIGQPTLSLKIINHPEKNASDCLDQIGHACRCRCCYKNVSQQILYTSHCLKRIALTIIRFLWILVPVVIHEDIPPTITALKHLYYCTESSGENVDTKAMPRYGIELVLFIFTGRLSMHRNHSGISAASSRGVCVFFSLLKDPSVTPINATVMEVMPGHIKNHEHTYLFITDISMSLENYSPDGSLPIIVPEKIELVAMEMEDQEFLAASYRVTSSADTSLYLGVVSVVETLNNFLRNEVCHIENCTNSLVSGISGCDWSLQFTTSVSLAARNQEDVSLDNSHSTTWSVLAWDSWDPINRNRQRQRVEIDVIQMDFVSLYLSAVFLDCRYLRFPYDHKRNHFMIAPLNGCCTCIVRLVSLM